MASEQRIDEQSHHHQQTTDPGPSTPIPSSPSTHQQHQQEDITPKHSRIQSNRGHSSSDTPHKKRAVYDEEGVGDDDDVNTDAAMAAATAVSAPALNASFPSSTSRPPLMSKNSSNMGGGTFELPPMPVPFEDFHFSLDLPDNIQASDLSLLQSSDFDSLFGGGAASAGVGSSSGGNLTPSLMSSSALFGSMTPAVRTPAALQPGNGEDAVMTSAPMSAKASQQHAKAQAMPARPQENAEGFFSFDSLFGDQQRQQGQSSQQHQQSQQSQQPGMHPGMQPGSSQQPSQTLSEAQQAPLFDTSESDFLSNFLEGFESSWDFNPALPENMPSFAAAAAQHSARGAPYGIDGRTPTSMGGASSSSSGSVMGASPGQYPIPSTAARRRGRTTSRTSNDFPSPMRDGSNGLQMESAAFGGGMNGSNPITSLGHAAFGGHLDGMEEDEGDVQGAATGSKRGVTSGNNGRFGGEKRRGSLAQTQLQALGGPNGYGGPYGTGAGPPMFFPPQQYGAPGQPWPSPGHMGGGAPSPYGASPGRMHMMPGHPHHPHHPGHPATPAFAQPGYSPRHGGPPPLPPPQMSASPHSMQAMPNNSKKGGSSSAAAIAAAAAKKAEEDEAAAKRELLTDREKRQNHILSEQRRRNHIREGFTELVALLDLGRWHGARGLGLSSGAGTGIEDEGLDDRSEVSSDEESDEEMKALAKSRRKKAKAKRMTALSAATATSNGRTPPSLTSLSASKGKGKGRGRGGSAGGGAGSKSAVLFQAVDLIKWLEVSNDKILRQCELLEEKAGCGQEPVEVVSAKAKAKGADSKGKEQGQPAAAAAAAVST